MPHPLHRVPLFALAGFSLPSEPLVLADGSLWSHAATLGTRVKGDAFTIDRTAVENFVRVFQTGYPQKVPVDYEHGTTNGATALGQPVPKAGDVLELRGVFGAEDFTSDLRAAAEKLAQLANRPLEDPRNFGLWARWRPTARALRMIKEREYTELSIAFDDDLPHNSTGEGQGPGLLAIALTNLPFLDDMLPVAASRGAGGSPADPGSHHKESSMTVKLNMLSVVAAILGTAPATEDEALTALQQLGPELTSLRQYRAVVGEELGETDPAKVVVKLRQLKAENTTAKEQAVAAKKAAVKTAVESTLQQYEKCLTVPLKELIGAQLTQELEAGTRLEETKALATLKSLKSTGITERNAGADQGSSVPDEDDQIEAKAQELLREDPECKELARADRFRAYKLALVKAEKALNTAAR